MPEILNKIVANKRLEVKQAAEIHPPEMLRENIEPSLRDFRSALMGGREKNTPNLIAEIKRKSPSKTEISTDLDLTKIVEIYNKHASAISVLTDNKYFGGSLEDLDEANYVTRVPLLRKDFIIDEYQLLEARQFGADAVLLIAAILKKEEVEYLISEAKTLGLDALVEVHSEKELEKVLDTSAEIIGINNRNLETLEIDLETTHRLVSEIPEDKIIVAESGIHNSEDVERLAGKVDAILVGTSILSSPNIEEKLKELTLRNQDAE